MKIKNVLVSLIVLFQVGLYANDNNVSLWKTTLDVGAQFLPDYTEDGESGGYSKTRLFVDISIDSRWINNNDETDVNDSCVINFGGNIKLLGTASNDSNNSTLQPTSFNDVSDTLDASVYAQYVPHNWRFGIKRKLYSELGIISHVGVRSREKKSDSKDTIDTYYDLGLQYSFYRTNPYSIGNHIAKSLPDGYLGAYYRNYSDYNGFKDSKRTIVTFKYKVTSKHNFLIGCELNQGKYEDELYLTLTFRNGLENLLNIFGTEKN